MTRLIKITADRLPIYAKNISGNDWVIEANGFDYCVELQANDVANVILTGNKRGSISVGGCGKGNSIRDGFGDGDAHRIGSGDGNAERLGDGYGQSNRAGKGKGATIEYGYIMRGVLV